MKKIRAAALILAFALCFSALAAGCGSSGEDESSVTQDVAQIDRSGKNLVRPGIMTVDRPGADGSDAAAPDGFGTETPAPEPVIRPHSWPMSCWRRTRSWRSY